MLRQNAHFVSNRQTFIAFWYTAVMEFLCQKINPVVMLEAHERLLLFFENTIVLSNFVTVYIHLFDKGSEIMLVGINKYTEATKAVIR